MSYPVIIPFANLPFGVTSGSFSATFAAANLINQSTSAVTTFGDLLTALTSNNAYLNLHVSLYPGGEIPEQIDTAGVLEPITVSVLGWALAGMASAQRWRVRSRV